MILRYCLIFLFLVIAYTDYVHYIIPNIALVLLLAAGVFKVFSFPGYLSERFLSAIAVSVIFLLLNYIFLKKKQKQIIGYGDIKFFAVLFFIYPLTVALIGLWVSSMFALIAFPLMKMAKMKEPIEKRIPFGFFLAVVFSVIEFGNFTPRLERGIISVLTL